MSQSNLNTSAVPAPGTEVLPQTLRAAASQPPAASQEQVLSWEAALGRAEQGEARPGAVPCASPDTAGAPGQEWSPMNPHGTPAGGEAAEMAGARTSLPTSTEPGVQAQALPAGQGDLPAHMSPEELAQRKWDRMAMGLEPSAALPGEAVDAAAAGEWSESAEAQAGASLAQPVTWVQPMVVGWQSLPVSERPVADGMTTEELVSERHVEQEHADEQAYQANEAVAAEQARLAEVNTPETLPERTIESV